MKTPTHPGTVVFADDSGAPDRVEQVSTVPESIAFVTVGDRKVPVTRVVASTQGDRRVIRSYDAEGNLLLSTIQVRPKR